MNGNGNLLGGAEEIARMYQLVDDIEKRVEILEKIKHDRTKLRVSLSNITHNNNNNNNENNDNNNNTPSSSSSANTSPTTAAPTSTLNGGEGGERDVTLDIEVHKAETALGQCVFVVGNIKELGLWETSNAFQLNTASDIYPTWRGTLHIHYSGEPLAFKICKMTDKNASSVIWDNHPDYNITPANTDNQIKHVVDWHDS